MNNSALKVIIIIYCQLLRLGLRLAQRTVELPALWSFGFLVLFGYMAALGFAVSTGQYSPQLHTAFIHYLLELPLGTTIDPDHLNLTTDQLGKLFLVWGTAYFIVAEAVSFVLDHVVHKHIGRPRLWLLGIIAAGYGALIVLIFIVFKTRILGVGDIALFMVAMAAVSLSLSYLLDRWGQKIAEAIKTPAKLNIRT